MVLHRNKFALYGCITLILGGLAHLVLVDICAMQFDTSFATWLPDSPKDVLQRTTIDFEPLGATNAFRAFSGFSVWVALSLLFIGAQGLFVNKFSDKGNILRTLTWSTYFLISIIFACIAVTCFIWPAAVGGIVACILFSLAVLKERKLTAESQK